MDCPVCKYPNKQGATHCGMCYEVFYRSAAQTYIQEKKRQDRKESNETSAPKESNGVEEMMGKAGDVLNKFDWALLGQTAISYIKRLKVFIFVGAGLVCAWILAGYLLNPDLWNHLFGKKLVYAFSEKAPEQYLVGLTQSIKTWSERGGRLDTPMEEYKVEEIGNVLFEKKKGVNKNSQDITLSAKEWIQVLHDAKGSTSHAIALNQPSLANAAIVLDKKGTLIERHGARSHRLAKGLPFLVPKFPRGALHHGQTWIEPVEWVDVYNDWKLQWSGTLQWTLGELEPCSEGTCARLTYQADVRPQLWAVPSWATHEVRPAEAQISTDGTVLFDVRHQCLLTNTFSYGGLLRIPINDLGRIPWELRIGRRVKGLPGEIVMRFDNQINIRKN